MLYFYYQFYGIIVVSVAALSFNGCYIFIALSVMKLTKKIT